MIAVAVQQRLDAFLNPPPPVEETQALTAVSPATGMVAGGGAQPPLSIDMAGRMPGVGMPPAPYTSEYGPSVPEGAEQQVPL